MNCGRDTFRRRGRRHKDRVQVNQSELKPLMEVDVSKVTNLPVCFPSIRLSSDVIRNLIPPFNPDSPDGLNAEQWIQTVENLRQYHGWDDKSTLLYSSLCLEDEAKIWFRQNLCDWNELKSRLVASFPPSLDRSEYFDQLLRRRKQDEETYENYAFDVARIAKKCNFNFETTINYIISGLRDGVMRQQLIELNCRTISELLSQIKEIVFRQNLESPGNCNKVERICLQCNQSGHFIWECSLGYSRKRTTNEMTDEEPMIKIKTPDISNGAPKICVQCNQPGHLVWDCKAMESNSRNVGTPRKCSSVDYSGAPKICLQCNQPGHLIWDCKLQDKNERSDKGPSTKTTTQDNSGSSNDDLVKTVKVDNVYLKTFVNLGSEYTTIQLSEFEKHDWKLIPCDEREKELSFESTKPIGKIYKIVCAGDVEMRIDVFIVQDSVQKYPLVLGRNFLDNPHVCIVKKYGSLKIKFVNAKKNKKIDKKGKLLLADEQQVVTKKEKDVRIKQEKREEKIVSEKKEVELEIKKESAVTDDIDEEEILQLLDTIELDFL